MAPITADSEAAGAVSEVALTATAMNIVQVDWANTSTKVSIAEGNCICWKMSIWRIIRCSTGHVDAL